MICSALAATVVLPALSLPAIVIGSALIGASLSAIVSKITPVASKVFSFLTKKIKEKNFCVMLDSLNCSICADFHRNHVQNKKNSENKVLVKNMEPKIGEKNETQKT